MQERDRLSKGTWHRQLVPGVVPLVRLDSKLDPAIDALADALAAILQICPDAYIKKQGLPCIHSDVALDPAEQCAACGRQLSSLRVLCASCRRAPTELRRSHPYIQLCWQGSNPRLFSPELLETFRIAEAVEMDAREAIQICIQTDGEAGRVARANFRLDDLRKMPHWQDAEYFAGLAPLIATEIFPLARAWVERVDQVFGERSRDLQKRLDSVAAQIAAHSAWHVELTEEDAVAQTYAEIARGVEEWNRARVARAEVLKGALLVLENGMLDERAREALPRAARACGPRQDAFARMCKAGDLRAVEQWRNTFGEEFARQLKAEMRQLQSEFKFPPATLSEAPNVPELAWVAARRQLDMPAGSPPALYPEDTFRVARVLTLVTQMIKLGDLPVGTVRTEILRSALRKRITSAIDASDACRAASANSDLAFSFLRGQSLIDRPGPLVEDEVVDAVCCLRHFSLAEIGTLVSVGLEQPHLGSDVMEVLKDRIVQQLPSVWAERGYREFLQHTLPALLVHVYQMRSERASNRNPMLVWNEAAVLWALPKVREMRQDAEELVLFREDLFGNALRFVSVLFGKKQVFYRRRVGTRMAICCSRDDVVKLLG